LFPFFIPYANLGGYIAAESLRGSSGSDDYRQRCMESKGYKKVEDSGGNPEADCMQQKGYEWE